MAAGVALYGQADPAIEARADVLLRRMTLAEKVGQMVQITPYVPPDQALPPEEADQTPGAPHRLRPGLDDLIRAGAVGSLLGTGDVELVNRCQRIAVEDGRLGIPLLVGNDIIHGFRTVFPIPLAESCTWNPPLLEQAARVAAEEASAAGTDWIFAPMLDISRDPRWGRIAEGAGEDPCLCMAMARARVRGFQAADLGSGRRVVACPKHFAAYGAAEAGRDYNTVDVSERTLREVYLPPFKAALDAGAGSIMTSFNDISGLPSTCNPFLLRSVLRQEWEWQGVVVSDYDAIRELIPHGVAGDLAEAARLSALAGVDMDMMSGAYAAHLEDLVEAGAVPLRVVDGAAGRILRLKMHLGLFERPYADAVYADQVNLQAGFRDLALEVARQSMVLLKNRAGLLPLASAGRRIALIGPLADNRQDLLGCWSIHGRPEDVETVREGVQGAIADPTLLTYVPGCSIAGDNTDEFRAAVAAAREADVAVIVVGESADMSGEAHSRAHLGLPGRQQDLVDAVVTTGTPVVCVVMTGRPLAVPHLADRVDALLIAWHGGIRAGRAIADILFGAVNPSGKLTTSWPRTEGQIPVYYNHKSTGRPVGGEGTRQFDEPFKSTFLDEPNAPLFAFGAGLSFTTFTLSDLTVEPPIAGLDGTVEVSVSVENTGDCVGAEVVQVYVRDHVASVTRPVKELKAFERVVLQPRERRTVRVLLPVAELGFHDPEMRYEVQPGRFTVWVGPDSTGGLVGEFEVVPAAG